MCVNGDIDLIRQIYLAWKINKGYAGYSERLMASDKSHVTVNGVWDNSWVDRTIGDRFTYLSRLKMHTFLSGIFIILPVFSNPILY